MVATLCVSKASAVKKSRIGRSAAEFLTPLCEGMEKVQRLDVCGSEMSSIINEGLRYSPADSENYQGETGFRKYKVKKQQIYLKKFTIKFFSKSKNKKLTIWQI